MDSEEPDQKRQKRMEGEDSDLDDDFLPIPDDVRAFYEREAAKSEGFDIPKIPGAANFNLIQPEDIEIEHEEYAQLAIDEYNRRYAETVPKLEFVKVLKVMFQLQDIVRYYITFEAKDVADGGKIKTYQAVVRNMIPEISVASFRLKPTEVEQGSGNHGKEWIWEGHLCRVSMDGRLSGVVQF